MINLVFTRTDIEKTLIRVLEIIFLYTKYGLCFWHLDKIFFANCKLLFEIEEI